ncbi:MAG: hypothetical protein ABI171_11820 [Collimonas sp.]|uniref:hypothetical protein n=1 Tax=Collimonas sp. TaxID=1963772 RepID=UPI0032676FA8
MQTNVPLLCREPVFNDSSVAISAYAADTNPKGFLENHTLVDVLVSSRLASNKPVSNNARKQSTPQISCAFPSIVFQPEFLPLANFYAKR